jgi:hypothetical protein
MNVMRNGQLPGQKQITMLVKATALHGSCQITATWIDLKSPFSLKTFDYSLYDLRNIPFKGYCVDNK